MTGCYEGVTTLWENFLRPVALFPNNRCYGTRPPKAPKAPAGTLWEQSRADNKQRPRVRRRGRRRRRRKRRKRRLLRLRSLQQRTRRTRRQLQWHAPSRLRLKTYARSCMSYLLHVLTSQHPSSSVHLNG
jgi:hypothetical protein